MPWWSRGSLRWSRGWTGELTARAIRTPDFTIGGFRLDMGGNVTALDDPARRAGDYVLLAKSWLGELRELAPELVLFPPAARSDRPAA